MSNYTDRELELIKNNNNSTCFIFKNKEGVTIYGDVTDYARHLDPLDNNEIGNRWIDKAMLDFKEKYNYPMFPNEVETLVSYMDRMQPLIDEYNRMWESGQRTIINADAISYYGPNATMFGTGIREQMIESAQNRIPITYRELTLAELQEAMERYSNETTNIEYQLTLTR